MIMLLLGIMALLAVGLVVITAVSIGWWLIPVAVILLLLRKTFDAARRLFHKDDTIVMSRKEFEANYIRRPNT